MLNLWWNGGCRVRWPRIQWTPTSSGKEWGMKRLSGGTLSKASFVSEIQPKSDKSEKWVGIKKEESRKKKPVKRRKKNQERRNQKVKSNIKKVLTSSVSKRVPGRDSRGPLGNLFSHDNGCIGITRKSDKSAFEDGPQRRKREDGGHRAPQCISWLLGDLGE